MVKKLILGAVASLAMTVGAQAATINGTGSFGVLGVSADTALIGVGTTFTFGAVAWGGGTGDFNTPPGLIPIMTPITADPITASNGSAADWASDFGAFAGTVISSNLRVLSTGRIVEIYALGTFTPALAGVLGGFDPGPMSMTWSATQTGGPGSAVSVSWTIASPPSRLVPEPGSLALLGLGLAGIGFASRRRKAG